jgi:hypothetical protein
MTAAVDRYKELCEGRYSGEWLRIAAQTVYPSCLLSEKQLLSSVVLVSTPDDAAVTAVKSHTASAD